MARQYLNVDEVAALFRLTKAQVYHLVRRPVNPLPYRKMGKQLRFDLTKLHGWFDCLPGRDGNDLGI